MSRLLTPVLQMQPLQDSDLEALVRIEACVYSHPWTRGQFADALRAGYWMQALRDEAGGLIAYIVAMEGVEESHLLNLAVAPDHQGQGHARALLDALVAHAGARGDAAVWLEVRPSNLRALLLYRRHGFVAVGTRKGYYPALGGREDATVMRRALARGEGQ